MVNKIQKSVHGLCYEHYNIKQQSFQPKTEKDFRSKVKNNSPVS